MNRSKKLFYVFALFPFCELAAQDTIISYPYPNGIITNSIEEKMGFRFSPVDNPNLMIVVNKNETKAIKYASGKVFLNPTYKEEKTIVLSSDPKTGKIYYSDIIEVKGAKVEDLYQQIKMMPQGLIQLSLITSDDQGYSFQKYMGSILASFQGDPYYVIFNLLVRFKAGKIMYEYTDFIASFSKNKTVGNVNDYLVNLTIVERKNIKTLEQLYSRGARGDDKEKIWIPIRNNIEGSITQLKKLCEDTSNNKKKW